MSIMDDSFLEHTEDLFEGATIIDEIGEKWIYGNHRVRPVGDDSKGAGYAADSFIGAISCLLRNEYIVKPLTVHSDTTDFDAVKKKDMAGTMAEHIAETCNNDLRAENREQKSTLPEGVTAVAHYMDENTGHTYVSLAALLEARRRQKIEELTDTHLTEHYLDERLSSEDVAKILYDLAEKVVAIKQVHS